MINSLDHYKAPFNSIGWFIPPYVTMGFLSGMVKSIREKGDTFSQSDLEQYLSIIYSPDNLAAMVTERYPITPCVSDYQIIISEAVEAHFMGLDHVAVAGLLPVIEGAGSKLAASRSVSHNKSSKYLFVNLAADCKEDVIKNSIGAVGEIVSMLDAFIEYATNHLYANSASYLLSDKTNRHGILHGAYADKDYGEPVNFYKVISAVDVLCFISALRASISWLAPDPTETSALLAAHYRRCLALGTARPKAS